MKKLTVRVTENTHATLLALAEVDGLSLAAEITKIFSEAFLARLGYLLTWVEVPSISQDPTYHAFDEDRNEIAVILNGTEADGCRWVVRGKGPLEGWSASSDALLLDEVKAIVERQYAEVVSV